MDLSNARKVLLQKLFEGFRYHPYIFMLGQSPTGKDAIYPYAHQVELLYRLFARRPLKVLIGDEIGLGKTMEAIMLLRYLQEVGDVRRALILVPRVLVNQWESELRRVRLEPKRIERDTISGLANEGFPEGIYLSSIDLIKKDRYKKKVLNVDWDIVIVDEAHRVGVVGGKKNARYSFLEDLIKRKLSINVVLMSATPHRGKVDDYIQRLRLVDPYLHSNIDELDNEEFYNYINGALVFKRTKPDVNNVYEKDPVFRRAEFIARVVEATEDEKNFHNILIKFLSDKLHEYYKRSGEEPKGLALLLTLIAKRASSSPKAALKTFNRILEKRSAALMGRPEEALKNVEKKADEIIDSLFTTFEEYGEVSDEAEESTTKDVDDIIGEFVEHLKPLLSEDDLKKLNELINLAGTISNSKDSRLIEVIKIINEHLQKGDKVVVFTEFKDTAEYAYEALLKTLSQFYREKVCLVTASEIKPPKVNHDAPKARKYNIENVKDWLKRDLVDVIVSTDVASEGLNLQYANIIIHYEPTWSPIKIVQRIGRVWRVGQKKDVYSYSILLTTESDLAVFENLYGKLLSWLVAGVESNIVVGEKLEINLLKEEGAQHGKVDTFIMPVVGSREEKGYSEYRAITNFLEEGKKGLESYVNQLLSMLQDLKSISERVESRRGEKSITVENIISAGLGGLCRKEAYGALLNVLEGLAQAEGCSFEKRSDRIFINCPGLLTPVFVESVADIYETTKRLTGTIDFNEPIILLAIANGNKNMKELHLFKVDAKLDNRVVYSEVVGVSITEAETKLIRGAQLLGLIAEAIPNIISIAEATLFSDNSNMASKAKAEVSRALRNYVIYPVNDYINFVERKDKDLSDEHKDWKLNISINSAWIGSILFIASGANKGASPPPPIAVEEVERRAMEFVMELEKKKGREPKDVSKHKHYDIESHDPSTGETRYIEVKGRWEPTLAVELTEAEFEKAKDLGKDYWLYIVYDISSNEPKLVVIRDPVNNVIWQRIPEYKYRLVDVKRGAVADSQPDKANDKPRPRRG